MGQLVSNNGLVHEKKGQAFTNSRMVSENFDKRHEKVLRDIENICKKLPPKNGETYFVETYYKDSYGRKQKEYLMNRDGFTLLAMGFTGKKAMDFKISYIEAFNNMESFIKNLLEAKADFPEFTDAITQAHTEPKFYHYSAELDMINRIATGMSAKQFKISNNLDIKTTSIRPHLTPQQLEAVKALQRIDIGLVHAVTDFQQRKAMLEQQYIRLSQKLLKTA